MIIYDGGGGGGGGGGAGGEIKAIISRALLIPRSRHIRIQSLLEELLGHFKPFFTSNVQTSKYPTWAKSTVFVLR